jgi:hypothetical protein
MISDKSSLASRLGWIVNDTEQAIEQARQSFSQYVGSVEKGALSACRETCRQISGVLDILGANGASMLSREIVQLLDALIQGKVENLKAAQEAAAEGLLQLSEYLKHLREGYADLPVVVLPTLNNLRAARDAELLSEHLVFLPEAGHADDTQIGTQEHVTLTTDRLQQITTKLRFYFQKALLGWFRDEQPARMLQASGKVATNLIVLNESRRLRALWWITAGLADALEHERLEHSVAVKMLMGRMEREIRRFGDLGETAFDSSVPDELFKNLLYYVGLAESGSVVTDRVKAAYKLDLYLPQGETLVELRQHYTTPGRDLWRAVAGSVIDELKALQGILEAMQDEGRQSELLEKLADKTQSLSSTLAMLGLGQASELTADLGENLKIKATGGDIQHFNDLLQISTHYARLEKVLEEYAETGCDTTEAIFGAESESQAYATERGLLRTTLVELSKAQTRTVDFYRKGWSFFDMEGVVSALENVNGALGMVGATELSPMIETALRYARDDLLVQKREPAVEELEKFADVLTLLDASISARLQGDDYLSLLPTGFAKLRELDQASNLNLIGEVDLDALMSEIESKKKAIPAIPPSLYQRLRQSNLSQSQLLTAVM